MLLNENHTSDTAVYVWGHNELNLCVTAWADNAVVKTLSNFHCTMVIEKGIKQSGLDENGKKMKDLAPVDCPKQMVAYW